jgi:hypothetical protein
MEVQLKYAFTAISRAICTSNSVELLKLPCGFYPKDL